MHIDLSFYKNKKILITGHTGFKGSWMCRVLQILGADVYGYALSPGVNMPDTALDLGMNLPISGPDSGSKSDERALFDIARISDNMDSIIGDIRDYDSLSTMVNRVKPEIVIHMVAQPIVRESYRNPLYTYETNVMGTANILEACRQTDSVASIVNVTTDKVYRNDELGRAFAEGDVLDGYDPYSNSKSCSELVTATYRRSWFIDMDIPVSTCRAGNVIGGGDFASDRIIPDCFRAAAAGDDIIVRNPYSIRPYQHVLEPVVAYLVVAMRQYQDHSISGSYNIGPDDENCITTGDMVDLFCEKWEKHSSGRPNWINKSDGGPHEAGFLKLDNTLFKKTFGYDPIWTIDEAVDKTVEWYAAYSRDEDAIKCMDAQISQYLKEL